MPTRLIDYSLKRSWVTIGSFDGVHRGHQSLVRKLVEGAHASGCQAVVITFDPHPAVYFKRVTPANLLTSVEEREALLYGFGVDQVITLHFDASVANRTAQEFMQQMKEHLGIVHLLAGVNFALGKDRAGNLQVLNQLGSQMGIQIEVVPPLVVEGQIVSSSQIRQLLQTQQLEAANALLSRPFRLSGLVVHGEARGSHLGFPTANMQIPSDRLLPANGVYATCSTVEGKIYPSVTNVGVRPTFENPLSSPRVEPHFLDVSADFYDKQLDLDFIQFLRPEIKFPDAQALIEQVNRDIQKAREVLTHGT